MKKSSDVSISFNYNTSTGQFKSSCTGDGKYTDEDTMIHILAVGVWATLDEMAKQTPGKSIDEMYHVYQLYLSRVYLDEKREAL